MTKNKNIVSEQTITIDGNSFDVIRIKNDTNGNPRYVVHFLALGIELEDYGRIKGLTRYRAKWFGGGYVIQSYHIEEDLQHALAKVKEYYEYNNKEEN